MVDVHWLLSLLTNQDVELKAGNAIMMSDQEVELLFEAVCIWGNGQHDEGVRYHSLTPQCVVNSSPSGFVGEEGIRRAVALGANVVFLPCCIEKQWMLFAADLRDTTFGFFNPANPSQACFDPNPEVLEVVTNIFRDVIGCAGQFTLSARWMKINRITERAGMQECGLCIVSHAIGMMSTSVFDVSKFLDVRSALSEHKPDEVGGREWQLLIEVALGLPTAGVRDRNYHGLLRDVSATSIFWLFRLRKTRKKEQKEEAVVAPTIDLTYL